MACTINADEIKRVKALGFLNNKGTDLFNGRIITVNGKINAEQTRVIAEAAQKFGNGDVEFTTRLTVEVRGIHFDNIEPFREYIAQAGLQTGGTGSLVRPVVSCKGTTCQYGLYDTFALSEKIHERFYMGYRTVKLPHKFKIATGGCPNNCVKPDLNDLGIVGQLIPNFDEDLCNGCKKCKIEKTCPMKATKVEDGILEMDKEICNNCGRCIGQCPFDAIEDGTTGYKIYIGGRWGKKIAQGKALSKIFTSEEEVLDVVEKAILLFREQGRTGERFSDTIERIGFEEVERQLLSNELFERKEEILAAKLHLAGGASC
ncbi:MAG: 4Fe-4S binding protein [Eubacteriales bacterium]|nr:4Fe-4S binding protein [Eubacteriales bacterium]